MAKKKNKEPDVSKQTAPPPPRGRQGEAVNFWIRSEVADALRAFLASQGKLAPTKTAVFEVALEEFLISKGFAPSDVEER